MIMTFVVAHRGSGCLMLRLINKLRGWRIPTPQERANRYVSRMPIAVLAPPTGEGHR
jgi:hypothetical protein